MDPRHLCSKGCVLSSCRRKINLQLFSDNVKNVRRPSHSVCAAMKYDLLTSQNCSSFSTKHNEPNPNSMEAKWRNINTWDTFFIFSPHRLKAWLPEYKLSCSVSTAPVQANDICSSINFSIMDYISIGIAILHLYTFIYTIIHQHTFTQTTVHLHTFTHNHTTLVLWCRSLKERIKCIVKLSVAHIHYINKSLYPVVLLKSMVLTGVCPPFLQ